MKRTGKDSVNSWIIAACCSFISLLIYGMIRVSALLYVACILQFQVDRRSASWPFMICDFIQAVLGPVTGVFAHQFGIGSIMITGCFFMAFGISSNFCAENISSVTILWGVLFGTGFGLICPLLPVVTNRNFIQKRATAIGFVYVGGYLGIFIFPIIIEFLLENYELSGTFLLLGGIVMHCLPAAMIMQLPNFAQPSNNTISRNDNITREKVINSENTVHISAKHTLSNQSDDVKAEKIYSELKKCENHRQIAIREADGITNDGFECENNKGYHIDYTTCDYQKPKELVCKVSMDEAVKFRNEINVNKPDQSVAVVLNCVFLSTSKTAERDLRKYKAETESPLAYFNSMDAFPFTYSHFSSSKMVSSWSPCRGRYDVCKSKIPSDTRTDSKIYTIPSSTHAVPKEKLKLRDAFKVFLDPFFFVILYSAAVFVSGYLVFLMVIVDFAMDIGLPLAAGKYIIMGYSFACCVGLLSFGWVTDGGYLTPLKFASIMFFIRSFTLVLVPFSNGFLVLLLVVVFQGFCETSILNLLPLIIADRYSEDIQEIAVSCRLLLCGPVYLATPTLIGYFRDTLGSYVYLFYLISLLSITSCVLLLMAPLLQKCRCCTDERIFRNKEDSRSNS